MSMSRPPIADAPMMGDLVNFAKQFGHQHDEFDGVRISLASPEMIRSWSLPVLFMLGTLLITFAKYASVSLAFTGRLST